MFSIRSFSIALRSSALPSSLPSSLPCFMPLFKAFSSIFLL